MPIALTYPVQRISAVKRPGIWWFQQLIAWFSYHKVMTVQSGAVNAGTARTTYEEDARLTERAQMGDQGAFRQLFEAYSPLVYRVIVRMVGSRDDAADLTQDVFVRAYERLDTLREGRAFYAWITRLAVNMAYDHARKRQLVMLSLDIPPPGCDEDTDWLLPDERVDQVTLLQKKEVAKSVQRALLMLSPAHRTVVVLHHLEEWPVEEIAQVIGVPVGTVKSRLSRARAELRQQLSGYLDE